MNLLLEDGGGLLLESGGHMVLEAAASSGGFLLLESGAGLLLESGGRLLLESSAPIPPTPSAGSGGGSWSRLPTFENPFDEDEDEMAVILALLAGRN